MLPFWAWYEPYRISIGPLRDSIWNISGTILQYDFKLNWWKVFILIEVCTICLQTQVNGNRICSRSIEKHNCFHWTSICDQSLRNGTKKPSVMIETVNIINSSLQVLFNKQKWNKYQQTCCSFSTDW